MRFFMFKRNKKRDKNDNDNLDEEYKNESEKLVEQKMDAIQKDLDVLEPKDKIDTTSIPNDLTDLQQEIIEEDKRKLTQKDTSISGKNKIVTAKFKPELKSILPVWVEKPFYYITPNEKLKDRNLLWKKEWSDFLLQWANAKDKYIIEIILLQQEYPFKNPVIHKQLKRNQLEVIGDHLVLNKLGKWRSKNKSHIRLYWESIEETAETIYQWSFERGNKYLGVFDILDADQAFSELPKDEIYECMLILIRTKKAEWADKKKEMIYLLFPT